MYNDLDYPAFLSHPSLEPEVFGKLDFHRDTDPYCWSWSTASVLGHCNGLLLYEDKRGLHVVNPATQRRALLPPPPLPPFGRRLWGFEHLVFDPAESPHYNVLLVPEHPGNEEVSVDLWQKASSSVAEGEGRAIRGMASIDMGVVCVLIMHRAVGGEGVYPGRRGCRDGFR
ncbi:hypothetical protein GQ55_9G106000 [Panicum hallii var. hallii]|uniref:Uncharacterized protein n=1 Tax=Panicum hallii var. hallii TaxID=1504633 RepID=A0A2T7C1V1_9POAL|nr:hypothetical protein GQ55_9G106000 [Panicum hallii var. hallii]